MHNARLTTTTATPMLNTSRACAVPDSHIRKAPHAGRCLQILSQVSQRLVSMHAAGHVHRDVKPTTIVLLPRAKRWVLSSFTCAARAGTRAPLRATLAYAAPEAVRAYDCGDRDLLSTPELDSWSLGVLAYELLTGRPAFHMTTHGREQVRPLHPQ